MDMVTIFGLIVGVMGIVGGMLIEGGHLESIMQFTAGVIVLGGTFGAVLVSTTKEDLRTGLSLLRLGFSDRVDEDITQIKRQLVSAAQVARRDSILALEGQLKGFANPFMRDVFRFVIDGVEPATIRDVFEARMDLEEDNLMAGAKIYSDAGGFSPTMGIIGAVLGLIQVMANLTDTSKLGAGIAVAFVATVYGIAAANLVFLPLGNKIKRKVKKHIEIRAMILEGAIGVVSGLNPVVIEEKLNSFLHEDEKTKQAA
jgi:chemotaxis protein MotA